MDRLSEYVIKHSSCAMPRCEYVENGIEIDCDKCQEIMMQEHDAKIRADAIDDFLKKIEKHQQENWIDNLEYGITFADLEEVAEALKEQK